MADTPGVFFDFSQFGIEQGVRAFVYARHGFQGFRSYALANKPEQ